MAYEIGEIKKSQQIFSYLLKNHEMSEKNEPALYNAYITDEHVQALVKSQGEEAECSIAWFGGVIYLIPDEDNNFLGFSKNQLKKELCKSGARDKDFYLSQFIILTILVEFYDGKGSVANSRAQMKVGLLQNIIADRLREGAAQMDEEEQDCAGIAFSDMYDAFQALKSSDKGFNGRTSRTTKEGLMSNVLHFLENQGLIIFVEADEMIKTTAKLDNLMNWDLLNQANIDRVRRIVERNHESVKQGKEEDKA